MIKSMCTEQVFKKRSNYFLCQNEYKIGLLLILFLHMNYTNIYPKRNNTEHININKTLLHYTQCTTWSQGEMYVCLCKSISILKKAQYICSINHRSINVLKQISCQDVVEVLPYEFGIQYINQVLSVSTTSKILDMHIGVIQEIFYQFSI